MHEANIIRSQLLLHKVYIVAFKEKNTQNPSGCCLPLCNLPNLFTDFNWNSLFVVDHQLCVSSSSQP